MASRPPSERVLGAPLSWAERAPIGAATNVLLVSGPTIEPDRYCLAPCASPVGAVAVVPAATFEGAQEFFLAAADWFDAGANQFEPVTKYGKIPLEAFGQRIEAIRTKTIRDIQKLAREADGNITPEIARKAVALRKSEINVLKQLEVPTTWLGVVPDELTAMERDLKRLARRVETVASDAKKTRRTAQKIMSFPKAPSIIGKWSTRIKYITFAINYGASVTKFIAAKTHKDRNDALIAIGKTTAENAVSSAISGAVGFGGTVMVGLVLGATPAGWVAIGIGLFSLAAGAAAEPYVSSYAEAHIHEWIERFSEIDWSRIDSLP
jgi:hypothetical protein